MPVALAFVVALLAPPLLCGGVGFVMGALAPGAGVLSTIIGGSAVVGGPSYLLVGAPLFWRARLRGGRHVVDFVRAGLMAHCWFCVTIGVVVTLILLAESSGVALLLFGGYFILGLIFAPLYGALFGFVFTRAARDPSQLEAETVEAVFR